MAAPALIKGISDASRPEDTRHFEFTLNDEAIRCVCIHHLKSNTRIMYRMTEAAVMDTVDCSWEVSGVGEDGKNAKVYYSPARPPCAVTVSSGTSVFTVQTDALDVFKHWMNHPAALPTICMHEPSQQMVV